MTYSTVAEYIESISASVWQSEIIDNVRQERAAAIESINEMIRAGRLLVLQVRRDKNTMATLDVELLPVKSSRSRA